MLTHLQKLLIVFIVSPCLNSFKSNAQCSELFGLTSSGGKYDAGTIFKTNEKGDNLNTIFNFPVAFEGGNPNGGVVLANNGKFYGMAGSGGSEGEGVLFEWDPASDSYIIKYNFNSENGSNPKGSLLLATNGKLYGMTSGGGANNNGVLFSFDPVTGIYTKIFDFNGVKNGSFPEGSLFQASNGKIYGMTTSGGVNHCGVIFEWSISSDTCIKKVDFDDMNNGKNPVGSLIEADNGKLYGMTSEGGIYGEYSGRGAYYGYGVLFEWDPATDSYLKKVDFNRTDNGNRPSGSLIKGDNGKLYGLTYGGGLYGKGILFEWDVTADTITRKLDFEAGLNGSNPSGSLTRLDNGKLCGVTTYGGTYNNGIIFEWDPVNDIYTKMVDFKQVESGINANGYLAKSGNEKLYGLTSKGGKGNNGVLFEWDPLKDTIIKKIDFNWAQNGANPMGSLVETFDEKLYGITNTGGEYNLGVLFEWDPVTDTFSKILDFNGVEKGANPMGSLIQADNKKLYGMTSGGGINNSGVLYEWDPATNTYSKKIDFVDSIGRLPMGSLVQASNGKLYGMTSEGGSNLDPVNHRSGFGVIFEWNPDSDIYTKKYNFSVNDGYRPQGTLIAGDKNKLYGIACNGGIDYDGVIFEWVFVTDTYLKKHDFTDAEEVHVPNGYLVKAGNGKLYGLTWWGGQWYGSLFEWNPFNNVYTQKVSFDYYTTGGFTYFCSLLQAGNGKIYGMTNTGGENGDGTLFEFDPPTNTFTKKTDFDRFNNGREPQGGLIEVRQKTFSTMDVEACKLCTSPGGKILSTSGVYTDTIANAAGCDSIITINLTIKNTSNTFDTSVCKSYTSPSGIYIWKESGLYVDTITNAAGCDSIITIDLTILKRSQDSINVSACDSFTSPSGKYIWTNSGIFRDTIPNCKGCDSIITINLTIDKSDVLVHQTGDSLISISNLQASYQWLNCSNGYEIIQGETNNLFIPESSGSYAVKITRGACIDTSGCYEVVISGILENNFNESVTAFPNPSDGNITISFKHQHNKIILILKDLKGRIIAESEYNSTNNISYNINAPNGIYLIHLFAEDNKMALIKVIKN